MILRVRLSPPSSIAHVQALTEGHEGMAVVRTKDAALGVVEFWSTASMAPSVGSFVDSLGGQATVVEGWRTAGEGERG